MPIPKSAPGGRESSQENYRKPEGGANAMQNQHGQQGQAKQDSMVHNPGEHSFKKGQE